ncbi:GNAT family N-acetyltransferase [Aridibaculum aurantiacum]|uniref:GNAT family N-acetyltransferase n=1 Tax=Aridibaculum aurantiacum TaxID=2810307 RepID=UPI001A964FD4|nr:N-acetyltransferase [Aridibaculum aurantiacum]
MKLPFKKLPLPALGYLMIIRKATPADAEAIATHLLLAMEDIIFRLIGEADSAKAKNFLLHFTQQENNQYSYENCWVGQIDNDVIATVNIYNGAELHALRQPVLNYLKLHYNRQLQPEDETGPGEFYIDTLGVSPHMQGRGVGAKMLQLVIDEFVTTRKKTVGLLVEPGNVRAKKLFERLGFKPVGIKTLLGKQLDHLQIVVNRSL